MRLIGNIIWFVFGGLLHALLWFFYGLLLCATIIGIPIGIQCLKLGVLQLAPFGKRIEMVQQPAGYLLANIIWMFVCGWQLALANLASAALFAVTIVGIPFAIQSLKMARLSLMPFGSVIITDHVL